MTTLSADDRVGSDSAATFAREHPTLVRLGRAGWVAKGVVYTLTGLLAFAVALQSAGSTGGGSGEASQSGAIATLAEQPAGAALLVLVALGLLLYIAWRLVTVILPAENEAHAWLARAGYLASAVSYTFLAWSAVSIARSPGTSEGSEDARVEQLTRDVLSTTGGRSAILVVAAIILGIGGYFLHKGASAGFESDLGPGGVGPVSETALVTMGRLGWVGRGLMMELIGVFLAQAAITFDPDDAVGLDGALRKVAGTTPGTVLTAVVAVGLILYGVYCVLSAPRRRLVGAD